MAPTKGILYVTMHPKSAEMSIDEFHDWYQNEHGPARLRIKSIVNGFRYKATGGQAPGFMAIYDLEDMQTLLDPVYTSLRTSPLQSQRERDVMAKLVVDRRFYDLVAEQAGPEFKKLEDIENSDAKNVMVAANITLKDDKEKQKYEEWFDQEHVPLLSKVPGWRRSRRFVTSTLEEGREFEILALHEYAIENGLDGKEFKAAVNTPWRDQIFKDVVKEKRRKVWELFYIFGPASRDLEHPTYSMELGDGVTKVMHDASKTWIESIVTTDDGAKLRYRLDGSKDPNAPAIVLINAILTDLGIWDSFVDAFGKTKSSKYRFVRFNLRGRDDNFGSEPVTVGRLAKDVICLLDALKIYRADAVIGVSLGGATALNLALDYPERIGAFVSCDTNSKAPEGNPKAWTERISVAEKENAKLSGVQIVGDELADMTVTRWFTKASQSDANKKEMERVKRMVSTNTLDGFKTTVKALFQYDMTAQMKTGKVKGLFLSGGEDGVLPKTMKTMAAEYGDGSSKLAVVEAAGHLPMVEQPQDFTQKVAEFLVES